MKKYVSEAFDDILRYLSELKRERNNLIVNGSQSERKFRYVRDCLRNFTQTVINKDFSTLTFDDIDTRFLQKYIDYLDGRNVDNKLQKLRRVFRIANEGIAVFDSIKLPVKSNAKIPKTDYAMIEKIKNMDCSQLTEKEKIYIDLFLFGYHTGGSTINEIASFKLSHIKNGCLYCRRSNSENIAAITLCSDALHIVHKYRAKCFDDYLLPIFTHKHMTSVQQLDRIKRCSDMTNQTLKKISKMLHLKNRITMGVAKRMFIEHSLSNEISYEMIAQVLGCSVGTVFNYDKKH